MWISLWIKLSWHSCSMLDKFACLSWFWQILCEGLSSFNLEGLYYSYVWSCSLCEGRSSFCRGLIFRKLCKFLLVFSTGFSSLSVLLLFSSMDHLFCLYAQFLILFHLSLMKFSRSVHLLMYFSLQTLTSIIRTG